MLKYILSNALIYIIKCLNIYYQMLKYILSNFLIVDFGRQIHAEKTAAKKQKRLY